MNGEGEGIAEPWHGLFLASLQVERRDLAALAVEFDHEEVVLHRRAQGRAAHRKIALRRNGRGRRGIVIDKNVNLRAVRRHTRQENAFQRPRRMLEIVHIRRARRRAQEMFRVEGLNGDRRKLA